ncbi:winged helix-turn-helix domain-containing protein [Acidicapsa ligni]|uniref:winged helix-turn-helix domain-containing protein n=1 Tax=Acidicapsa ligni TaxID=542300 RepID=UPI0037BF9362
MDTQLELKSTEDICRYLITLISETDSRTTLIRAQSILLRHGYRMPYGDIAQIIGWSTGSVRNYHCLFRRIGVQALFRPPLGGRRHFNIPLMWERELLKAFSARARSEGSINVKALRAAYEHLAGHAYSLSTIYRLVQRHGYSRQLPNARRVHRNS